MRLRLRPIVLCIRMALNTYKQSQAVDVPAILVLAGFLRALSPDGEEWRSSNPNNPAVINIRELAEKLLTTIRGPI